MIGQQIIALACSRWWSSRSVEDFQKRKLIDSLGYAVNHVRYYGALGIDANSIRSVDDLRRRSFGAPGNNVREGSRVLATALST